MEDGAIGAQPPAKLVEKLIATYGDDIVVQEEVRCDHSSPTRVLGLGV